EVIKGRSSQGNLDKLGRNYRVSACPSLGPYAKGVSRALFQVPSAWTRGWNSKPDPTPRVQRGPRFSHQARQGGRIPTSRTGEVPRLRLENGQEKPDENCLNGDFSFALTIFC